MELFEDLEFKPITEGLGFHRNTNTPSSDTQTNSVQRQDQKPTPIKNNSPESASTKPAFIPSLKPEYNFLDEDSLKETKKFAQELNLPKTTPDRTKIYEPIGRKDYSSPNLPKQNNLTKAASFSIPVPGAPASLSALRNQAIEKNKLTNEQKLSSSSMNPAATSLSNTIAPNAKVGFSLHTKTANPMTATSATMTLKKTQDLTLVTCIPAAILDSIFAIGVSLTLLVGVLLVTKADLVGLLSNSKTDHFVQAQIGILFLMVLQMYILVSRSTIFGQSIGEWTYEIQLGTDEQKSKALYPVQVVFRGLLFAATGFVLIPFLSELFGRDLAAPLTGLKLQKITQQGLNF